MNKTKVKNAAITARTAALHRISNELLDQAIASCALMTELLINATTVALKNTLIERALGGELLVGSTWRAN